MKTLIFKGSLHNATGCAVSINLWFGNKLLWTRHYFAEFNFNAQLETGSYTLDINGYTQGSFKFDIQDTQNINPGVPKTYDNQITDSFGFQI
jgi:hypothetical protein